jgi:hypothetical protein
LLPQVTDAFGSYRIAAEDYFKQLAAGFRVTASLVCDSEGNTVNDVGSSKGLGNNTDLALLIALRRQAEVILTSGATFRADEYRFPKFADLAVLTNQEVEIAVPFGQRLHKLTGGYSSSLADLRDLPYRKIHVEYGVKGIRELIQQRRLDALFLSSPSMSGVSKLAAQLGIDPDYIQLSDLYVGLMAWQTNRLES